MPIYTPNKSIPYYLFIRLTQIPAVLESKTMEWKRNLWKLSLPFEEIILHHLQLNNDMDVHLHKTDQKSKRKCPPHFSSY